MTREELKAHCEEQVAKCEALWAEEEEKLKNHRLYQEHKLILELLEQVDILDKIRVEIAQEIVYKPMEMWDYRKGMTRALEIIDKYKAEQEVLNADSN